MEISAVSIDMIKAVAMSLADLNEKTTFVGGATLPFYIPTQYHSEVRTTDDVDIVMEVVSALDSYKLDEKLRSKGFTNDMSEGAPTCRWKLGSLIVDVMSSNSAAMGFTNIWYDEGIKNSWEVINDPVSVKIFKCPFFLASKIEAFNDRGGMDFRGSPDMEDVIAIMEVVPENLLEEYLSQFPNVHQYLVVEFQKLLKNQNFLDALPGLLFNRADRAASIQKIKNRMNNLFQN